MNGTKATEILRKLFKCGMRVEAHAKVGREELFATCCRDGELRIRHLCKPLNGGGQMESNYIVGGLDDGITTWNFPDALPRAMTWVSALYALGNKEEIKEFETVWKSLQEEPVVTEADMEVLLKGCFNSCKCGGKPIFSVFANDGTYRIRCPRCGCETARSPNRDMVENEWKSLTEVKE